MEHVSCDSDPLRTGSDLFLSISMQLMRLLMPSSACRTFSSTSSRSASWALCCWLMPSSRRSCSYTDKHHNKSTTTRKQTRKQGSKREKHLDGRTCRTECKMFSLCEVFRRMSCMCSFFFSSRWHSKASLACCFSSWWREGGVRGRSQRELF